MNFRKTALAVALAGSLGAPLAVHAASVNIDIDVAPPAAVYEQLPARAGYGVTSSRRDITGMTPIVTSTLGEGRLPGRAAW